MKRFALLLCVFFAVASAHAGKLVDFKKTGINQTGNTAQIGMTGGVSAFAGVGNVKPNTASGWHPAGNYGVAPAATGPTMSMGASGNVFFADAMGRYNGVNYPFQAAYAVSKADLWGAASMLAKSPLGMALVLGGPYIADWMTKAGARVNATGDGVELKDPAVCSTAPCYEYGQRTWSNSAYSIWKPTKEAACAAYAATGSATYKGVVEGADCAVYNASNAFIIRWSFYVREIAPSPAVWLPKSMDDIAPYMAKDTVLPDPRVVDEILQKGGDIKMPAPTVTGPSSVDGPTSTTTNSDGTKTVSKTTYNFTNNGDTITNTTNTTTTTTYNTDNSIRSSSSTTVTPTKDQQEATPVDTDLPDQPKLYTRKYPDGLVGVWNTRKAELNNSPLARLTSTLTPTISTAGGCPQFTVPAKIGPLSFGSGWQGPPCAIWDFCKVVVLLSAAFLARALIFGG